MERRRTGGMTATAVLNIVFGGLVVLMGLFLALGVFALLYEQSLQGVFELPMVRSAFAILVFLTGVVGLVAGIGVLKLRPWARALSFAFATLLLISCVLSFFTLPIVASVATISADDLRAIDTLTQVRLAAFSAVFIAIPVFYAPILCLVCSRPAWKATFVEGAEPPPLPNGAR